MELAGKQILQFQTNSEAIGIVPDRRSANYKPNIWKYDFLQTLSSSYDEEQYKRQAERLKEDVKHLFAEAVDSQAKLKLVDCITKLGLASYFQDEIKIALDTTASLFIKNKIFNMQENLYFTALCFRLLRQHGYEVSQDIFSEFIDEKGISMKSKCLDIEGILELLEASRLAQEDEDMLEDAKTFSTRILKGIDSNTRSKLSKHVAHSLELPSHWRVQWFDVKWQINKYQEDNNINKVIIDLAKINFNIVQATLQKDLKEISRWWRNLGLIENLNFSRDRLVESFMCSVGLVFEPKYSSFRKWLTKVVIMILVIDDVYDIYGTLEELELFTNAVIRWDGTEIHRLPECMQLCFHALYNTTNETAHQIQREKGWDHSKTLGHLKRVWADFCQSLFVEAKWFNKGYTPSLQEYLDNGWISSSGSLLSVYSFFSAMDYEMLDFLGRNQHLIYNISLIIRLCNDLGTSGAEQERGDAASSIICYMREMNVSEEVARSHIEGMINKIWKKINGECFASDSNEQMQLFININTNMARVVHNLYQNGDGFGAQGRENKKQMLSLLVDPLKLN